MSDSKDFIFKKTAAGELEFVGDFDGYYKHDTDPWGQSGKNPRLAKYYQLSRLRTQRLLADVNAQDILIVGCGTGHTMDFYQSGTKRRIEGVDISPNAIRSARQQFPRFDYHVADIMSTETLSSLRSKKFDTLVFEQILWYLLDDLNAALANAADLLTDEGRLIISNGFERDQLYGKAILNGYAGTVDFFGNLTAFSLRDASYYDDPLPLIDGHFVLQPNPEHK